MQYLWDKIEKIKLQLNRRENIALLLDFDGTISSISRTPEQARLDPYVKRILTKLVGNDRIRVGIVSGRSLSNLKDKIDIPKVFLAGNHGLEWIINNKKYQFVIGQKIKDGLTLVKNVLFYLKKEFPQIIIEDKGISLSVHVRSLTKKSIGNFKKYWGQKITTVISSYKLKIVEGKKVFEIRPEVNWHKGSIVDLLFGRNLVIYIGDDETDEDVFKSVEDAITVRVGKKKDSRAKFYVKSVSDVAKFLKWILNSLI